MPLGPIAPGNVPGWSTTAEPVTDLGYYQRVVRRGWRVILLCLVLGVLAGGALFMATPRTYSATASVLVTDTGVTTTNAANSRTPGGDVNLDTEVQLLKSAPVRALVVDALGGRLAAKGIAQHLQVTVPANTNVLDIAFTAGTPRLARDGAQAFADAYLANRKDNAQDDVDQQAAGIQTQIDNAEDRSTQLFTQLSAAPNDTAKLQIRTEINALTTQINTLNASLVAVKGVTPTPGRVINDADLPGAATAPKPVLYVGSGLALGLLLGLGLSMWTQRMRPRLVDEDDVARELQLPVLAEVRLGPHGLLSAIATAQSAQGMAFAGLHRRLDHLALRRVIVAPVSSNAAALHVSINLAWQYARAGTPVRLVLENGDTPPDPRIMDQGTSGTMELVEAPWTHLPVAQFTGTGMLATRAPFQVVDLSGAAENLDQLPPDDGYVTVICAHAESPLLPFMARHGDAAVLLAERDEDRAPASRRALRHLEESGATTVGLLLHPHYGSGAPRAETVDPARELMAPTSAQDRREAARESAPKTASKKAQKTAGPRTRRTRRQARPSEHPAT